MDYHGPVFYANDLQMVGESTGQDDSPLLGQLVINKRLLAKQHRLRVRLTHLIAPTLLGPIRSFTIFPARSQQPALSNSTVGAMPPMVSFPHGLPPEHIFQIASFVAPVLSDGALWNIISYATDRTTLTVPVGHRNSRKDWLRRVDCARANASISVRPSDLPSAAKKEFPFDHFTLSGQIQRVTDYLVMQENLEASKDLTKDAGG